MQNRELVQMVELGQAAVPLDLMTYSPEDKQPSAFLLQEDKRQSMLAVFNWTEQTRYHAFTLADLKLPERGSYEAYDVFNNDKPVGFEGNILRFDNRPPHSVRLIKIIDTSIPPAVPEVSIQVPTHPEAGKPVEFSATPRADRLPVVNYHWDFGDGTAADGREVTHTYTRAADYIVQLKVDGVDGVPAQNSFPLTISGIIKTEFDLPNYRRYVETDNH